MNLLDEQILVTGGSGFIGTNLLARLTAQNIEALAPSHGQYDLTSQYDVRRMFIEARPTVVFHLAGLVGGIGANMKRPAEFHYQNLVMGAHVMHAAWASGVKKLVTLIGGCSYPADAESPISEACLLRGYPQTESAPYSLAKAMSVVQAQAYRKQYSFNAIVLVPGNVYGPHDNFDLGSGHVVPVLVRRFVEARLTDANTVTVWGTGRPIRDFVYVEDVCDAILVAAEMYDDPTPVNISSGVPTSIYELAEAISGVTKFTGRIIWDQMKPDGQAVKILDVRRQEKVLGHVCGTQLVVGLEKTVAWYRRNAI